MTTGHLLSFTYGIYVCMYPCIHTCVGAHASSVGGSRALSSALAQAQLPWVPWHRTGQAVREFNAIPSRQRKRPPNLKEGEMMWFCKGVIFCFVCVSLLFPLSLHLPSPTLPLVCSRCFVCESLQFCSCLRLPPLPFYHT